MKVDLKENIGIGQRWEQFDKIRSEQTCKLQKVLHRRKQASSQLLEKIHTFACHELVHHMWPNDLLLSVKPDNRNFMLLTLYFGDLLIVVRSRETLQDSDGKFSSRSHMMEEKET